MRVGANLGFRNECRVLVASDIHDPEARWMRLDENALRNDESVCMSMKTVCVTTDGPGDQAPITREATRALERRLTSQQTKSSLSLHV